MNKLLNLVSYDTSRLIMISDNGYFSRCHVDQAVRVSILAKDPLLGQAAASTVALKVTGLEIAKLGIGRTSVIDVEKEVI